VNTRFDGTLKKWDADRGLGFVMADQGGEELFVHVSAFPRDGRLPTMGEALSFEIDTGQDGKKSAVRIQRRGTAQSAPMRTHRQEAYRSTTSTDRRTPDGSRSSGVASRLISVLILAVVG
jgi:cold shock CspA family protein